MDEETTGGASGGVLEAGCGSLFVRVAYDERSSALCAGASFAFGFLLAVLDVRVSSRGCAPRWRRRGVSSRAGVVKKDSSTSGAGSAANSAQRDGCGAAGSSGSGSASSGASSAASASRRFSAASASRCATAFALYWAQTSRRSFALLEIANSYA